MTYETHLINPSELEAFVQGVIDDGDSIHFIYLSNFGGRAVVTVAIAA